MKRNTWFRFYNDVINDPKVQMLPKALRWSWVELLCLASKHDGVLPSVEQIAFSVRASVNDTQADIDALILAGLIDIRPDGRLTPHNWSERQHPSDSSAERTRNYRERIKKRACDAVGDVTVTAQIRSDQRREDNNKPSTVDHARSGSEEISSSLGRGQGGSVSIDAKRAVCATLAIGNCEPLIAIYHAWKGSETARDPDALFRSQAEKFYRDAPPDVKRACIPLGPAPPEPLPPVKPSSQLIANLNKGRRHAHAVRSN
jgi:hypothetical protein